MSLADNPNLRRLPRALEEAARYSSGDHPALAMTLERELEATRAAMVEQLAKGVKTWDEYLKKVGAIEGLDIAISRAKQVNDKLNA